MTYLPGLICIAANIFFFLNIFRCINSISPSRPILVNLLQDSVDKAESPTCKRTNKFQVIICMLQLGGLLETTLFQKHVWSMSGGGKVGVLAQCFTNNTCLLMLTTGQQCKLVQFWFHSSAFNGLSPFTGKYVPIDVGSPW